MYQTNVSVVEQYSCCHRHPTSGKHLKAALYRVIIPQIEPSRLNANQLINAKT
jgi:hypothetical protein